MTRPSCRLPCLSAGWDTAVQLSPLIDAAEHLNVPMMTQPQIAGKTVLTLGYAGCARRSPTWRRGSAKKFGISIRDILLKLCTAASSEAVHGAALQSRVRTEDLGRVGLAFYRVLARILLGRS
ncbi:hypothetical protein [Mycobacterium intracellulare]|uniref:hypothetical protein n=1 Tax=Mycobacterium intracellulare TaxID=1767 RepID=UPI001156025D|nr:hypothetical protein [Mycobacterium intracellulare]